MSNLIKLLPDSLANQIAAGEVVQRPASAVKELLENAIDAGADHIMLTIRDGGKTWIQVNDNGFGMSETDARMCFERHATSKLKEVTDLFNIRTMGFRGEALASIAAVAQVELKTKRETDELGTRILIEGSKVQIQEPCQCPKGTQIVVKNLFFNVPARKNFLKSDAREQSLIDEEFVRIAMAYPHISFDFFIGDRPIYKLAKGNQKQRVAAIQKKDVNKSLISVSEETDVIKISGFVGTQDLAKKKRGDQYFFVNGRYIQSYFLNHAVTSAFEQILPDGSYPFYVLFIDVDPAKIDVNVHPTKQEIKFEDERIIYHYLKVSVRHALASHQIVPSIDFDAQPALQSTFGGIKHYPEERRKLDFGAPAFGSKPAIADKEALVEMYSNLFTSNTPEQDNNAVVLNSNVNQEEQDAIFGKEDKQPVQIHRKYILCHLQSGIMILDQRAAHERILYERYLKAIKGRGIDVQQELFPKVLEFSATDAALLEELLPEIKQMGFDIAAFGKDTFVVHGTPAILGEGLIIEELVNGILEHIKDSTSHLRGTHEKAALALAKASAMKQGKALNVDEMNVLVDQLFGCEMPYNAPSGRKCFINMNLEELDQKFK
jgi:DNA mismatch repair protein MutL